jgi:lysozyme family protein
MEDNFNKTLDFTLEHEGGYVDNPADPGGATNRGISFRFLKGIDSSTTKSDIVNMTLERASEIYRTYFWRSCYCDELPSLVDSVVFDTAVNMGTGTSIKLLQKSLNDLYGTNLKVDGSFGPITQSAVEEIVDTLEFAKDIIDRRRDYYTSLANNKPRFRVFLRGWMNRINDLENFIEEDV